MPKTVTELDRVVIRFAGDSGDGMQLTGDRFTQEAAAFGNDRPAALIEDAVAVVGAFLIL